MVQMDLEIRDLYRVIDEGTIGSEPQLYLDGNWEWIFCDSDGLHVSVVDDKRASRIIITNFWR